MKRTKGQGNTEKGDSWEFKCGLSPYLITLRDLIENLVEFFGLRFAFGRLL
jgi:hypothetical protein